MLRLGDATRSSRAGRARKALAACLVAFFAAACDRNIEPYQAGEEPREPDLARIFPGPPAGGPGAAAGEEAAAGAGGPMAGGAQRGGAAAGAAARSAFPPSRTEGAGAADGAPISGRIELAQEFAATRPEGAILFVIARPEGATGGPPLAVLRIEEPEFPVDFAIGPGDVMIPSMRFEGRIVLTARLDSDGNAMTRAPEDLSSAAAAAVEPGATGLSLVLATRG